MKDIKKIVRNIISKNNSIDFITKGLDKISNKERKEINNSFAKEGLDGNGRFEKVDHALSKIGEILSDNGLEWDEVISSDRFRGNKGRQTLNIARKTGDPFSPISIKNSLVSFSWHLLSEKPHKDSDLVKDKIYEILAYLS
jgi:hypothetical protein